MAIMSGFYANLGQPEIAQRDREADDDEGEHEQPRRISAHAIRPRAREGRDWAGEVMTWPLSEPSQHPSGFWRLWTRFQSCGPWSKIWHGHGPRPRQSA